ncbi:MAG: hypothetical protein ABWY29_09110 [Blastococcus sp.]
MSEQPPPATTDEPAGPTASRGSVPPDSTTPDYVDRPVALRRPESLGGLLLILAGIAAGVSLLFDWLADDDASGLTLVREGFDDLGGAFGNGMWQPLAIVLGGGVLLVLGVMMWLPLRTHRFLGLLGLIVSLIVTAGVLVPLYRADWDLGVFAVGFWFGIAVAVLGLLGSLKALLTGPK